MAGTNKTSTTYHTVSQCLGKRALMEDDLVKKFTLKVIKQSQEKYDFKLIFYAIRDNHFHLVIQTNDRGPSVSRIMQFVKSRIAEGCNKKMNRIGPFWNGRSRKTVIEEQTSPGQGLALPLALCLDIQ